MQKLWNLDKWQVLTDGEAMEFRGGHTRMVRLEVNARGTVELAMSDTTTEGEIRFLALVTGRDVIEWSQAGPWTLYCSGEAYIFTADGQDWAVEPVDDATYTRVVERRARNIELERMIHQSMANIEIRSAAMAAENERRMEAAIAAANARADAAVAAATAKPADAGAGDGGKAGTPAKPAADGGAPDEGAGDAKP